MKSIFQILCDLEQERTVKDQLENLVAQMYGSGILYSEAVREFKKRFILNVLQQNRGNQFRSARELGMHRNTLTRTIKEVKLDVHQLKTGRGWSNQGRKPAGKVEPVSMEGREA